MIVDNRHIAPEGYTDGIVLNVPQRMLFVFEHGDPIRAFPVAVGRSDWRTPLGVFTIAVKELDPVWDVPVSIQREMARSGRPVLTRVDPGRDNPLGGHWLGLSVPGVGIHGTNQPASIYRFTTHGCIRMHPDDVAELFDLVDVGAPVHVMPSGGAVGTARAIAHAYGVFATGGRELGLRQETLDLLADPAIPPARGFYDECLKGHGIQFSLGFMKSTPALPFGSASAFGSPGAGGALGFADPAAGVGYAYVANRMGTRLTGDPRDVALRDALSSTCSGSRAAGGAARRTAARCCVRS